MRGDDQRTGRFMVVYINTYGNELLVEPAGAAVTANLLPAHVNVVGRLGLTAVQNSWLGRNFATYFDNRDGLPVWHATDDWSSSWY